MADTKISGLTAVTTPTGASELAVNEAGTSKKITLDQVKAYSGRVYSAAGADTAVNSTSDVTIVSQAITGLVAGDSLIVDAWFTVLNNSTATRVYTFTIDFDGLFDIEISGPANATSATLINPMHMTAVLDIRSTSLAYAMVELHTGLAAGVASGTDTTVAATLLENRGWGTTASDATGSTTVAFLCRSASATATQTLRLHYLTIHKAP